MYLCPYLLPPHRWASLSTESNPTLIVDPSLSSWSRQPTSSFLSSLLYKTTTTLTLSTTRETNQTLYIIKMSDQGSPAAPAAEVKPKADGESIFIWRHVSGNGTDNNRQHIKHQNCLHWWIRSVLQDQEDDKAQQTEGEFCNLTSPLAWSLDDGAGWRWKWWVTRMIRALYEQKADYSERLCRPSRRWSWSYPVSRLCQDGMSKLIDKIAVWRSTNHRRPDCCGSRTRGWWRPWGVART